MTTPDGYDTSFNYLDDDEYDPYAGWTFIDDTSELHEQHRGRPHEVSEDSDRIVSALAEKNSTASKTYRALSLWRHMGDERVRAHVCGLYLRKHRVSRELIAYVDTPVWVYEFSLMAPAYLEEWNYLCETNGVDMQADRLTFRLQTRSHTTAHNDGAAGSDERNDMPAELTDEERALVDKTTQTITDPKLRTEAYKAMKSVMEWEKGKNHGPKVKGA